MDEKQRVYFLRLAITLYSLFFRMPVTYLQGKVIFMAKPLFIKLQFVILCHEIIIKPVHC